MTAAEWAERRAQSRQAAKAQDAVRDALTLARHNTRTANFPDLAQDVIDSFENHCEEHNKRRLPGESSISFCAGSGSEYLLKRDAGLFEMQVQVDFPGCFIRVSAEESRWSYLRLYRPVAMEDGSAVLSSSGDGSLVTADDIVQAAMDAFVAAREPAAM